MKEKKEASLASLKRGDWGAAKGATEAKEGAKFDDWNFHLGKGRDLQQRVGGILRGLSVIIVAAGLYFAAIWSLEKTPLAGDDYLGMHAWNVEVAHLTDIQDSAGDLELEQRLPTIDAEPPAKPIANQRLQNQPIAELEAFEPTSDLQKIPNSTLNHLAHQGARLPAETLGSDQPHMDFALIAGLKGIAPILAECARARSLKVSGVNRLSLSIGGGKIMPVYWNDFNLSGTSELDCMTEALEASTLEAPAGGQKWQLNLKLRQA